MSGIVLHSKGKKAVLLTLFPKVLLIAFGALGSPKPWSYVPGGREYLIYP